MTNAMNQWIKKMRQRLIRLYGGECSMFACRSKEKLHFHHIHETGLKGKGRGRKERVYDIIHHPECYQLLCKECHDKLEGR